MQHGDRFYVAKWWTSNNQPGGDWGAWELLGDSCTGEEENKEEEEMMRLRKRRRLDSSGQEISSGSEERVGETMR